jgi:hypothetical protein
MLQIKFQDIPILSGVLKQYKTKLRSMMTFNYYLSFIQLLRKELEEGRLGLPVPMFQLENRLTVKVK